MGQAFPDIQPIQYEGKGSKNPLAFKHYNAEEIIDGKSMKDHLRFSVAYWHSFRNGGADQFGVATRQMPWDDGSDSVENAQNRARAAFEFISKMGIKYYCFHDRDIAPEGADLRETNRNLKRIVARAKQLQEKTGIKLLWGTANLFSHPRYTYGAATNPDPLVLAHAASQVRRAIDATVELGEPATSSGAGARATSPSSTPT